MVMKSVQYLILIAFVFISCSSKKSNEELFNEARSNTKELKIPYALASFEELLSEYPNRKSPPEALANLASIYQNKMIKNITETESLQ